MAYPTTLVFSSHANYLATEKSTLTTSTYLSKNRDMGCNHCEALVIKNKSMEKYEHDKFWANKLKKKTIKVSQKRNWAYKFEFETIK